MRKLLLFTYITSVLLFAGLAHASNLMNMVNQVQYQTPIQIGQVTVDDSKLQILVAGELPNPCYTAPSALLTQSKENPSVLILRLTAPVPMGICVSRVKPYATVVSLPMLVQASQVHVDRKTVYTVRTEGYDFQVQVPGDVL